MLLFSLFPIMGISWHLNCICNFCWLDIDLTSLNIFDPRNRQVQLIMAVTCIMWPFIHPYIHSGSVYWVLSATDQGTVDTGCTRVCCLPSQSLQFNWGDRKWLNNKYLKSWWVPGKNRLLWDRIAVRGGVLRITVRGGVLMRRDLM